MLLFNQFAMSKGGERWCNVPSQLEPFWYIRTGDFNSTYNPKLFALVHQIESRQIIFQDEFDTLRPLCYPNTVQQHFSAAGWQTLCKEHFLKSFEREENISVLFERLPTTATLKCNKAFVCILIFLLLTVMAQDVFLICFSVNWVDSFEHVKAKWISEVHQPALYRY